VLGSPHLHPCAAASYATPYTNRPFPQCSAGSFAEKSGCRDGARRAECLNLLGSAQICLNLLQHAQTCSSPLSYAGYSHSFRLIPHTLHPLFALYVFSSASRRGVLPINRAECSYMLRCAVYADDPETPNFQLGRILSLFYSSAEYIFDSPK